MIATKGFTPLGSRYWRVSEQATGAGRWGANPHDQLRRGQSRRLARVQQLLYDLYMSVGFRPTDEDLRVIDANRREDENTSDVIRRALRLLDREAWEERARADMHLLRNEDLTGEPDAWKYDADGSIRIAGTSLNVPARPADQAGSEADQP